MENKLTENQYYALRGLFEAHVKLVEKAKGLEEVAEDIFEEAEISFEDARYTHVQDWFWTADGFEKMMDRLEIEVVDGE
jgi:hypothetical protein